MAQTLYAPSVMPNRCSDCRRFIWPFQKSGMLIYEPGDVEFSFMAKEHGYTPNTPLVAVAFCTPCWLKLAKE